MRFVPELAQALASKDLGSAVDWLKSMGDPQATRAGIDEIIATELWNDPVRRFELLSSMPELFDDDPHFSSSAFDAIAQEQPDLLLERFDETPERARPGIVELLLRGNGERPMIDEKVYQLVDTLPEGPAFDRGARAIAEKLAQAEPVAALDWASQIGDSELRLDAIQDLLSSVEVESIADLATKIPASLLSLEQQKAIDALLEKRIENDLPNLVFPGR